MLQVLREPVNALTHLIGAGLSVAGLTVLVVRGALWGTPFDVVSFTIFGASLILLYMASGLYHALRVPPEGLLRLRRWDHISIFVLIAGTYTPFCLGPLRGPWGWSLLGAIWGLALLGVAVKIFWMSAPRWLYVTFYVMMGWLIVVAFYPLMQASPPQSVFWLVAGGVIYTVGAVIYAAKWPNLLPGRFGFHEIWHLFVMAGSIGHYVAVYHLVG